jgi:hypothetical protein
MAGSEGEALPLVECEPIVSSSLIVKYVGFSETTAERFRVADTAQRSIRAMLQTGAASLENLVPMTARDTGQQPTLKRVRIKLFILYDYEVSYSDVPVHVPSN